MRGFLVAASAAVAFTAPAHAQRFDDTVTLKVEAYFAGVDSFVRVGLPERPGTGIDMEDVLGLDDSATLPAVQIGWRANDDWVFNAEYYRLGRRSQKTLDREIVVGDTTYPVSATVGAGFDSDIYRFTAARCCSSGSGWNWASPPVSTARTSSCSWKGRARWAASMASTVPTDRRCEIEPACRR